MNNKVIKMCLLKNSRFVHITKIWIYKLKLSTKVLYKPENTSNLPKLLKKLLSIPICYSRYDIKTQLIQTQLYQFQYEQTTIICMVFQSLHCL